MKKKTRGLFLNTPEGLKVKRYEIGDSTRFTTPVKGGVELLIGYAINGQPKWCRKDCSF